MRKRILGIILIGMVFGAAACGRQENADTEAEEQKQSSAAAEEKAEDKPAVSVEEGVAEGEEAQETQEEAAGPGTIHAYYSNADATAFETEEVYTESLTPEAVLRVLVDKGVVTADVELLSFQEADVDGTPVLQIDFNQAFGDYVSSMGTTGEYYIVGGVCNTFLKTYGCEKIKLTVEGNVLATGHAEYPGYLGEFS